MFHSYFYISIFGAPLENMTMPYTEGEALPEGLQGLENKQTSPSPSTPHFKGSIDVYVGLFLFYLSCLRCTFFKETHPFNNNLALQDQ
eukprot:gene13317-9153_t